MRMTQIAKEAERYFPYAQVRPFQDDFIKTVFEAVEKGQSVLIEGSNGLGKTIASLSACLHVAIKNDLKILYVARTHRQNERVIEELRTISRKQRVSGVSIRGRHEMCLNDFVTTNALDARGVMEVCELLKAKGRCVYYRRIKDRKTEYSDLQHQISLNPQKASEIQKLCRRKGFCPYELVKSSLTNVKVIASSYLYIFDPEIRNAFLKTLDTTLHKIILIVDEAHNLPNMAVEVASSKLSLFTVKQAEFEAKKFGHKDIAVFASVFRREIEKAAEKINRETLVSNEFLTELVMQKTDVDEPALFFEHLQDVGRLISRSLLADGKYPRSYIRGTGEFLSKWLETSEDKSYVKVINKYLSRRGTYTARLEIVALDPSKVTAPVFSSTHSNIVMSGTLQPLDAFAEITKLPQDTVKSVAPSPFPKEHILPLVSCGVTTAMEKRTPTMYEKIINRIREAAQNTPANSGIFTASFEVLEALLSNGLEKALDKPLFHEHRGMSSKENEKIVSQFKAQANCGGAVLLGVQGGRSSEGVDYPRDEMNSVIIVGVPYAEPTPKVQAQIKYFEECFPGHGREYGYVIPAMKKASQAAGRPIRTLEDRGSMIFLDDRFSTPYCQRFLPLWIRNSLRVLADEDGALARELGYFFKRAF